MMKLPRNAKGMTLLELVLSIAILGLIVASVLGAFTSGFSSIMSAGQFSKDVYVGQSYLERKIADPDLDLTGVPYIAADTVSAVPVSIVFGVSPSTTVINVSGRIEIINYNDGEHRLELATFVPD